MLFLRIYTAVIMILIIVAAIYDLIHGKRKDKTPDIVLIILSIPILLLAICLY